MNEQFAKGFGYKTQDVDRRIEQLMKERDELEAQVDKLKKEARGIRQQRDEAQEKITEANNEIEKLKAVEVKRLDEFSALMESGKKIVNQMAEDAKQEAAGNIYNSKKVLEEAKKEAEQIKSRSLQDVRSISALLAEIAKTSAKSKAQVTSLYDQIDAHYEDFVAEVQKKAMEIFPKEDE